MTGQGSAEMVNPGSEGITCSVLLLLAWQSCGKQEALDSEDWPESTEMFSEGWEK